MHMALLPMARRRRKPEEQVKAMEEALVLGRFAGLG